MFTSRPHGTIGTDLRFILDKDELVKKGFPMKPIVVSNFEKTTPLYGGKTLGDIAEGKLYRTGSKMNPRFEFEERVRGNIPTENIKLIDLLKFPQGAGSRYQAADIINALGKTDIPIIRNPQTTEQIETMAKMFSKYNLPAFQPKSTLERNLNKLLDAPTYKFDPFEKVR